MSDMVTTPPFEVERHIKASAIDEDTRELIRQLRSAFENDDAYDKDWCTDEILQLFLIARNMNVEQTRTMLQTAGEWRKFREPHLVEETEGWEAKMSRESETGKVYTPGKDRWGRPVIVLDNTVQNTDSVDDQMLFLAWNLEFGIKEMSPSNDKFLVFMVRNSKACSYMMHDIKLIMIHSSILLVNTMYITPYHCKIRLCSVMHVT